MVGKIQIILPLLLLVFSGCYDLNRASKEFVRGTVHDTRTALQQFKSHSSANLTEPGTSAEAPLLQDDFCLRKDAGLFVLSHGSASLAGSCKVRGKVVLFDSAKLKVAGAVQIDELLMDTGASFSQHEACSIGRRSTGNLGELEKSVLALANYASSASPTEVVQRLSRNHTFVGRGGQNVILLKDDLNISGAGSLTFSGGPADVFIINIHGEFSISGAHRFRLRGIQPSQIIFNVIGSGKPVRISGAVSIAGTIVALDRPIFLAGASKLTGALIGREINLRGAGLVTEKAPFCFPTPTPSPTVVPSPEPSAPPTPPEPNPEPTVQPSPEPNPEPTVQPSPEPSPLPTVQPSPEPSPLPSVQPPCEGFNCEGDVIGV
ncbi:MAG TPA: collagen-binding domain-containing protein [Bdellovibrionota bacterium]|nr:collagen-binding domain-containing protein [Bdellovibrionota bacterium]